MKKLAILRGGRILSILVLQHVCTTTHGQLNVGPGVTLKTVSGAFINLHNMDFKATGAVNQGVGAGTYLFSGNSDNQLNGTGINTIDRLIIAKTAGHKVTLNQNHLIGSLLEFHSGYLDINNSLLQIKPGATISGESDLTGIISSGNGYAYTTTTLNAPVAVNPGNLGAVITSSANLGETTIRRRHMQPTLPSGNTAIRRSYEIYATNNYGLDATLRVYYRDDELNGLTENQLTLWRYSSVWANYGHTTRNTTENYVEKTGIDAFSTWTLAHPNSALPVSLVSFQVVKTGLEGVALQWKTTTEANFREFLIERSVNPENGFTQIGRVASTNDPLGATYGYNDPTAEAGHSYYYRLKMVDLDDSFEFSRIVSAQIPGYTSLHIYPNPATSSAILSEPNGISRLHVLNAAGHKVADFTYPTPTPTATLELGTWHSGAYFLQVTDKYGLQKTIKLVVTH